MTTLLASKEQVLRETLATLPGALVAYSGGVDSAVLMGVAHEVLGARAIAVTAVSPSLSRFELNKAERLARRRGWEHYVVETHEVERERYARNEPDRCYWCKTELFEVLHPLARERDSRLLVGTNADDLSDHRPGLRAAREHDVLAPLADAGLTKSDVRNVAAALGLDVSEKPASPCLASRFAYGVRVTREGLERVERAEEVVRSLGFAEFRVRDHGDLARIEVPAAEVERAAAQRERLTEELSALGYRYVTLDLAGFRSGSLNEVLGSPRIKR
jgi:uncharacterized protein